MVTKIYGYFMRDAVDEMICMMFFFSHDLGVILWNCLWMAINHTDGFNIKKRDPYFEVSENNCTNRWSTFR